jgi:hypothetical protein
VTKIKDSLKNIELIYYSDAQPVLRGTLVCAKFFLEYHEPHAVHDFGHSLLSWCAAAQKRLVTTDILHCTIELNTVSDLVLISRVESVLM